MAIQQSQLYQIRGRMAEKQHFVHIINQFEKQITEIQSSKEDNPSETPTYQPPAQDRECDQQFILISNTKTSSFFIEQIHRDYHLFSKIQKTWQPKRVNVEMQLMNDGGHFEPKRLDLFFKRNIYNQKHVVQMQREKNKEKQIIWSQIQQGKQNCQININNKKLKLSFSFQNKKAELLELSKCALVPYRIIINAFYIMKKMGRLKQSLQVVSFSFLPLLLNEAFFINHNIDIKNTDCLTLVRQQYGQAVKSLQQRLFKFQYNVIPFIINGHYSMVIVKGAPSMLNKKQVRVEIIYCSSRFTANKRICEVIRAFLLIQRQKYVRVQNNITNKIHFIQLLLPKQVSFYDSGLYMILYCQTLLHTNSVELDKLSIVGNRNKLHLFPRNLVNQMRQRLTSLFVNLQKYEEKSDDEKKLETINKYFEFKKQCESRAIYNIDYDKLEKKEVTKLQYLVSGKTVSNQEERFYYELQYYYNREFNYYENEIL